MKKAIIILLSVFILSGCDMPINYRSQTAEDGFVVSGTIRPNNEIWNFIDNSAHYPMNVSRVETRNDCIIIYYSDHANFVNTFLTDPDEVFTKDGIFTGVSVGLDWAAIYLYKDGILIDPTTIYSQLGNIWFFGIFSY